MKRSSAFLWTVLLAGCCSELKNWTGGENDSALNTVRAIRYHMCARDWAAAARSLDPAYATSLGGDPSKVTFWKTKQFISEEEVFTPLGPEDVIAGDDPPDASGRVRVEINHAKRLGKDRRPRYLFLRSAGGRWLVVGDDNN